MNFEMNEQQNIIIKKIHTQKRKTQKRIKNNRVTSTEKSHLNFIFGNDLKSSFEKIFFNEKIVKKFVINEHIDMCLVEEFKTSISYFTMAGYVSKQRVLKTHIFVDGQKFQQCMYVILNEIPKEISGESIDEIIKNTPIENKIGESSDVLKPEEAFFGHCSNIQAWVDHDYNPNCLDSRISFPLLKKLSEVGDEKAKRIFESEIDSRLFGDFINATIVILEIEFESRFFNKRQFLSIQQLERAYIKWKDNIQVVDLIKSIEREIMKDHNFHDIIIPPM